MKIFNLKHVKSLGFRNITLLTAVGIVFVLGALVRFYQIDSNVYMGGDEGRDARTITQMLETHKPILQGPPTSITTDIGRVYYGPGYYYVALPAFILSGGNPASAYFVTALFGSLAVLMIYLLGSDLFGKWIGLSGASLYALSIYIFSFERWAWSPNWIPFFALLGIYGLVIMVHKKRWGIYLLALAFGIGWQLHYTFLFLAILVTIVIWRFKVKLRRRDLILALLLFLTLSSPMIINEFKYGFPNEKVLFYYLFSQSKSSLPLIERARIVIWGTYDLILKALGAPVFAAQALAGISLGCLSWCILLRRSLPTYVLFLWPLVTLVPIIFMYSGEIQFDSRFIMSLLPWTTLMVCLALSTVKNSRIFGTAVIALIVMILAMDVQGIGFFNGKFFGRPTTGLSDMEKAVEYIKLSAAGSEIAFDYHSSGGSYPDGYLYIMQWRGIKIGPNAKKTFSLYEQGRDDSSGHKFGPILVTERIN